VKRARQRTTRGRKRNPRQSAALPLHKVVIADAARLMKWPDVHYLELGWKEVDGRVTRRLSVKLHVTRKTDDLAPHERLPKSAKILVPTRAGQYTQRRVPLDVVWHAPATLVASSADFVNPIGGGALIGVPGGDVGTYTGVVRDASGKRFHLTAGHVVQQFPGEIGPHLPVLQPPAPNPTIPIGADPEFGETVAGFLGNTNSGFVDFALIGRISPRLGTIQPLDGRPVVPTILPSNVVAAGPTRVTKFGAVTGRTHAVFSGVIPSIVIGGLFATNVFAFKGVDPTIFGRRGDSGALVVSDDGPSAGMVVGILFAVSEATPDAPAGRGLVVPFDRLPVRPA
jgi:hypothetical protein